MDRSVIIAPRPRTPAAGARGFTLLEVLMAIVVIGILAVVVVPDLATSTASHRASETARRLHSDLMEARTRAIVEQRGYRLRVEGGKRYAVQYDSAGAWRMWGVEDTLSLETTIAIDGSSGGTLVFLPKGRAQLPRTLVVNVGGHSRRIVVLASGMVRWPVEP